MQFPVINMNGSNGQELLDQIMAAVNAVRAARVAVGKTIPHGRDYQTLDVNAYSAARDEHWTRCHTLGNLERELTELADNLYEQVALRDRQKRGVA